MSIKQKTNKQTNNPAKKPTKQIKETTKPTHLLLPAFSNKWQEK